ncbi:hypothetical protein Efla_007647 [Eimeria flavescens]
MAAYAAAFVLLSVQLSCDKDALVWVMDPPRLPPDALQEVGFETQTETAVDLNSEFQYPLGAPSLVRFPRFAAGQTKSYASEDPELSASWLNEEGSAGSFSDAADDSVSVERPQAEQEERAAGEELPADIPQPAPERPPLRGIKSIVGGSLLLALTLWLVLADSSELEGELDEGDTLVDKFVDSWWAAEDFMDNNLPFLPVMAASRVVLLGAGPALLLSGLVDLAASLRQRRSNGPQASTWFVKGLVLVAAASIAAIALFNAAPEPTLDDYGLLEEDFEIAANAAWGVHLFGVVVLMAGAFASRRKQLQQRRQTRAATAAAEAAGKPEYKKIFNGQFESLANSFVDDAFSPLK